MDAHNTDFATHLRTAEDRLEAWGQYLAKLKSEPIIDPDREDVAAFVTSPANTAAGAVNLLTAVKERTAL